MDRKLGSRHGFSMIELVLGLTLLIVVLGIGYRALLSINKQQTAAGNKAARLNVANSAKSAVIQYLGESSNFDSKDTTATYFLSDDPGQKRTTAAHLTLSSTNRSLTGRADSLASSERSAYNASKFKVKVEIGDPEPPIFDRRVIITVRNTDEGKGGQGSYEEEKFEYFLTRPRASQTGGSMKMTILNGDPDGDQEVGLNHVDSLRGVKRIRVSIRLPSGEIRYGRSGSDGQVLIYGIPYGVPLKAEVIGDDRGGLVPYYWRNCPPSESGRPASIWSSARTYITPTFTVTPSENIKDFGTVYLWPYARVSGIVKRYDDPQTGIGNVAVHFRPVHVEDPYIALNSSFDNSYETKTITKADGTYSIFLVPGFYYRATYGSVKTTYDLPGNKVDPDRRNPPATQPVTLRNEDPGNLYPYGLLDSAGITAHDTTYSGPGVATETAVIQKLPTTDPAFSNPNPSVNYLKCLYLQPSDDYGPVAGATYNSTSYPANNPKATNLRLKPMGDLLFQVKVATWSGGATQKYVDDPDQTKLSDYLTGREMIINAYNDFKKVFPFDFSTLIRLNTPFAGNQPIYMNGNAQFVGARMLAGFSDMSRMLGENNGGVGGGVGGGKLQWNGSAAVGDVPNFCVTYHNEEVTSGLFSDETDQFNYTAYPMVFPHGWGGALTPILILTNPFWPNSLLPNGKQQLYVFWHGHPAFTNDPYVWPNGRPDGVLYSVNPSTTVFIEKWAYPTATPSPWATSSPVAVATPDPVLLDYSIRYGVTGLNSWGPNYANSIKDPYLWFRTALKCDQDTPATPDAVHQYRVLPRSQLAIIRGNIVMSDGVTPWFSTIGGKSGVPAKVYGWGVEYKAGTDEGVVNFQYSAQSHPVPAPSAPVKHTYKINHIIPTLKVDGVASYPQYLRLEGGYVLPGVDQRRYGNGRVIKAAWEYTYPPSAPKQFYNLVWYVRKIKSPAGTYSLVPYDPGASEVGNTRVQITSGNRAIKKAATALTSLGKVSGDIYETAITGGWSPERKMEIRGQTVVMAVSPGADMSNVNIPMRDASVLQYPPYYVRLDPSMTDYVDWKAPSASFLGVQSTLCTQSSPFLSFCWIHNYVGKVTDASYYGTQEPLSFNKVMKPSYVKITVRDGDSGYVKMPGVQVTMYTSSLLQFRQTEGTTRDVWKERCTATTNAAGEINFSALEPGTYDPGDHDCSLDSEMTTFVPFSKGSIYDYGTGGEKNFRFKLKHAVSGKQDPGDILVDVGANSTTGVVEPVDVNIDLFSGGDTAAASPEQGL